MVVGNQIGANNVPLALKIAKLTLFQGMTAAFIVSVSLYIFDNELVGLFTDSSEEGIDTSLSMSCIFIFIFSNLVDMAHNCFLGFVRALGIQAKIAYFSISCFYLVSIPTALYLAFVARYGIIGLWLGYSLGNLVQMVIVACVIFTADWQEVADLAESRTQRGENGGYSYRQQEAESLFHFSAYDADDDEKTTLLSSREVAY